MAAFPSFEMAPESRRGHHVVNRYWRRYLGVALPGVEFPDVRRLLAEGFVESGYDLTWLIRELITSPAYTQEMMFR